MKKIIKTFRDMAKRDCKDQIEKMILFGSSARGDRGKESDIDLLIVWRGDKNEGWDRLEKIAFPLVLKSKEYLSLKIVTPQEFQKMEKIGYPIIRNIKREGIVLV